MAKQEVGVEDLYFVQCRNYSPKDMFWGLCPFAVLLGEKLLHRKSDLTSTLGGIRKSYWHENNILIKTCRS